MCIAWDPMQSHMIQIPIADGENPSVLGAHACMRVNVCAASDFLDLIESLYRFSYVYTSSHKCILVLGKIAQSSETLLWIALNLIVRILPL
jgi:hypothetical protein